MAFAANSVLCRLALGAATIDAASFSTIRLASGAGTLWFLASVSREQRPLTSPGNRASPVLLFLYAVAFSFAYVSLSTGTGTLILFGTVQVTMILAALRSGERPHHLELVGLLLASAGLAALRSARENYSRQRVYARIGSIQPDYSLKAEGSHRPSATL